MSACDMLMSRALTHVDSRGKHVLSSVGNSLRCRREFPIPNSAGMIFTRTPVDRGRVHPQVRRDLCCHLKKNIRLLTPPDACRSLIASYLGNIVGALLVGLPALYFYAPDYKPAGALREAEEGEIFNGESSPGVARSSSERSVQDKRGATVYEMEDKRTQ